MTKKDGRVITYKAQLAVWRPTQNMDGLAFLVFVPCVCFFSFFLVVVVLKVWICFLYRENDALNFQLQLKFQLRIIATSHEFCAPQRKLRNGNPLIS